MIISKLEAYLRISFNELWLVGNPSWLLCYSHMQGEMELPFLICRSSSHHGLSKQELQRVCGEMKGKVCISFGAKNFFKSTIFLNMYSPCILEKVILHQINPFFISLFMKSLKDHYSSEEFWFFGLLNFSFQVSMEVTGSNTSIGSTQPCLRDRHRFGLLRLLL